MPAKRGDGWIFQRGRIWWIQYCHRGKVFRETSRSEDKWDAQRLLRKRLGEIENGIFKGPKVEKTTFDEMAEEILNDYRINGRKSIRRVEQLLAHLREAFERDRMIDITPDRGQ